MMMSKAYRRAIRSNKKINKIDKWIQKDEKRLVKYKCLKKIYESHRDSELAKLDITEFTMFGVKTGYITKEDKEKIEMAGKKHKR